MAEAVKYNLSTAFHVERCKKQAEKGNLILLSSYLTYAMYDLGISQENNSL